MFGVRYGLIGRSMGLKKYAFAERFCQLAQRTIPSVLSCRTSRVVCQLPGYKRRSPLRPGSSPHRTFTTKLRAELSKNVERSSHHPNHRSHYPTPSFPPQPPIFFGIEDLGRLSLLQENRTVPRPLPAMRQEGVDLCEEHKDKGELEEVRRV